MTNCILKKEPATKAWYEQEIKKIDERILALKMAKPALRALVNASIYSLDTLRTTPSETLNTLHGMGPAAFAKLETLLL